MKALIRPLIAQLSKLQIMQRFYQGKGVVLMLHRVAPFESKLSPNENMKVTPEFLESFILESKAQGYDFISLDELYSGLMNNNLTQNFICFTLDDGYKDNLTYATPIFTRHNVPFCIYVCTSFPESTHNMWWFALEDYLLSNERMVWNDQEFNIYDKDAKESMFLNLRTHIIRRVTNYTDCASTMESLGINYNARDYDHLALTWDDITFLRELQSKRGGGICTIGCHTHTHPIFNNLTPTQITHDILQSQEFFKAHLGDTPLHFAYPFGSKVEVDSRFFSLIETLGFRTACTTRHGTIYPQHKSHICGLPRVFFSQNFMLQSAFRIRKNRIITD